MNGTLTHPIPENAPEWIADIMKQCFNLDVDKRPTMQDICNTLDNIHNM